MVTISYDEFNPDYNTTYFGVFSQGRQFYSGDVVKDFADAIEHELECTKQNWVLYSSSVDHFVMDVPGFCFDDTGLIVRDEDDTTT